MDPRIELVMTLGAVAIGLVVGSFLNVVIHRVPRRASIVRPGSACPACGEPIRWYDNIPVVSWIVLRARCRRCGAPISVRYPAVELAGAIVALASVWRWGWTVAGAEAALFGWVSVALALIDLEHRILPDVMTLPSLAAGLAFSLAGGIARPVDSLLGAVVGAAIPATLIVVYRRLKGVEGMGWGDVKYLGAIGAVVGVMACLKVLVLAAVAGAVTGIALIAMGRGSRETELPFGTFLAAATLLWLYVPSSWLAWIPW